MVHGRQDFLIPMFDIMRKAKSFIGKKKEHVHACFCVSDASGTYSKFAGTAICSLFENTAAPVTVHLLTDETLADDNRKRFIDLAARYGQEIIFYDVPEQIKETWQEAEKTFPDGFHSERYTSANMYRLTLPEVLPPEIVKVIYFDADIIVHLDIAELWREEINESGFAAVPDLDVLSHYGVEGSPSETTAYFSANNTATLETVFNAGMFVMRLDTMRARKESLLLTGARLLAEHEDGYKSFDNDILIDLFARTYTHLDRRYNIRLSWDIAHGEARVIPAIYHCLGRNYKLDCTDPRHKLFLTYYMKTPWFDEHTLYKACKTAEDCALARMQERMKTIRRITNVCRRRQRVFVGLAVDEARLREDFALEDGEPYMALAPGDALRLPYDVSTHVYLFFWPDYGEIKGMMEKAGYREYEHFADGTRLMPEQTDDLLTNDLTWLWYL